MFNTSLRRDLEKIDILSPIEFLSINLSVQKLKFSIFSILVFKKIPETYSNTNY